MISEKELLIVPDFVMGVSKTEINLLTLLSAAPRQQNEAKLMHVSNTNLFTMGVIGTTEGRDYAGWLAKIIDSGYSEKIEDIAASGGQLLRSHPKAEDVNDDITEVDPSSPAKLDAGA
ncbi:hypothetical protein IFM89_037022 [Coptis chinensis]|uniref:Uncharacterized protein n=1 Tax=Coptis chinensis TaxID=261450 RepID=A0A835HPS5_9MAGN|nr:hypothetical protein IFM89_037022 [Coptis chinensis]